MTNPRYLTVAQVAKELQVCRETVYGWVRHELIAVAHLPGGKTLRIPREAIEELVTPAEAPPPSRPARSLDIAARLRAQHRLQKMIAERRQR